MRDFLKLCYRKGKWLSTYDLKFPVCFWICLVFNFFFFISPEDSFLQLHEWDLKSVAILLKFLSEIVFRKQKQNVR